jgi:two-component system cell cycle sensor histidine kinase/response regulator CckA
MIHPEDILKAAILIVDDQQANITLLEQMLRGAGFLSVSSTSNPNEVCELHRQNRYALILLDLQMPGLDGFQVMEGLKSIETNGYLPVLVVTAQPGHKLRALKAGAKDFVSKPFDLAEVLMRVRNLLEVRLLHLESEMRTEQAEGRFIEAQKMGALGHLAGGVAHDFNNILAVIMGYSDLIALEGGADHPLQKHNAIIRQAADRAVGLTRQLLIFSRKQTVLPIVLDLDDEVRHLDKMLRRLVDESIELRIVPGEQTGRMMADPGYIGQVLMNLVVNARDAMPKGGHLSIATHNVKLDENYARTHAGVVAGDYVMLSVSDTGSGMTDEIKARIFEAFFTTKPSGKGTGLGLATCQTIVQQSGGHIGVYSEVGKGTTFKIYFPRVRIPLSAAIGTVHARPLPGGTETVLVVEDDASVRHLARDVLEGLGYHVLRASNGQHALNVAREHKSSKLRLVVTDVVMPVMGGKLMVEWLKTSYPDLKIIFTSGYTEDAIMHHGVFEPGTEFLAKPYAPAALARKVREMLDRPQAEAFVGANLNNASLANGV